MTDHIKIEKLNGMWSIRIAGAVIGEAKSALSLVEGGREAVLYFPASDIAMAFLSKTDHSTHCPHKGDASYYNINTKSGVIENVAWTYENPIAGVEEIKDHLAFYPNDAVVIEQV